jgi:hypothetical protein
MKLMKGTKQCLIRAQLHEQELTIVQAKRVEDLERKVTKWKVLQKSGGLTTNDAQRKIDALKQKEKDAIEKKERVAFLKLWRAKRDKAYREGVKARASERARRRTVKELLKAKQDIPTELLDPIPDPEAIWKAGQEEIKRQEAFQQQQQQQEEEEVTFIVDIAGDQSLKQDFLPFPSINSDDDDDSSTPGSDESGLYDSDNDYSWYGRHRGI